MDIKSMTVEQLKTLAYDEITRYEKSRQNLQILNQEIAGRSDRAEPAEEK